MNIEVESQIKRFELVGYLIKEASVTTWAEQKLMISENLSSELCDVVSAKGFEQQEKLLNTLANEKYENEAFIYICKKLLEQSKNDIHFSAKCLARIIFYAKSLNEDYTRFCSWLDTESDLMANGYKDFEPALIELSNFLTMVSSDASNDVLSRHSLQHY